MHADATDLIAADDPPPVEIVNQAATAPLLLISDHAGNAVPRGFVTAQGPLGLPREKLDHHIGWDIGAAAVARGLAARLDATAVLARYTRLLIDPNRALGDPECIPAVSDGIPISVNRDLDIAGMRARAAAFYWPYHRAIDEELARLKQADRVPLLIAMHSFTPALMTTGEPRPWQVGIMASRDERLSRKLVDALRAVPGMTVGFNQPYSGITHGYCLKAHGLAQGLPHAQIEIRQDLIGDAAGQARWIGLLADILAPIVADAGRLGVLHH